MIAEMVNMDKKRVGQILQGYNTNSTVSATIIY
jgi:hypothetical protein